MSALITFAIPYYRGLSFLEKTIQSVINQRNQNWKIVVLDDCGGEDAEVLTRSFTDSRIEYVRNATTLGLAANWNKALSLVTTELVTILHADDELLPNYTDVVSSLLAIHPGASAAHCRTEIIDEHSRRIYSVPDEVKKLIRPRGKKDIKTCGEHGLRSLLKGQWIFCPTICYRRSSFPTGGFSKDWMMVLDLELMSRILLNGETIVGSSIVAYRYRRHSDNQTAKLTNSNVRFKEEIRLLDTIGEQCSERGWNKAARTANVKVIIRLHLLYQCLLSVGSLKIFNAKILFLGALTMKLE